MLGWRDRARVLLGCAAVYLTVVSLSPINLGVRHVLVVVGLLALVAGRGALACWRLAAGRPLAQLAVAGLLAAQLLSPLAAWPHALAHRNLLFAGTDPPPLLDSDLDWGQGLPALRREVARRGIGELWIAYFGNDDLCRDPRPRLGWLPPRRRVRGWIAISAMILHGVARGQPPGGDPCRFRESAGGRDDDYAWLRRERPLATVGGSIHLFYVP